MEKSIDSKGHTVDEARKKKCNIMIIRLKLHKFYVYKTYRKLLNTNNIPYMNFIPILEINLIQ